MVDLFAVRIIVLLTEGMVDLFVVRTIDLLTDGMVDLFIFASTDGAVQYELNAQFLRLFGVHSDVNDAHRIVSKKNNGEVQTHEEATVYVKEVDIFLTMKVLENTPAVLSLGKPCDENGYSYEWINGQKSHLIKNGIRIPCNTENFVPTVVPGLSSSSSGPSSTLRTSMKQESHSSSSSSSSPSSPTAGEIQVREREDVPISDISPVPVSILVDDGSGQPEEIQAKQNPKTKKKKETTIERGNPCDDSEIPEWLHYREALTPVLLMKPL